jgi:hypothetical protein
LRTTSFDFHNGANIVRRQFNVNCREVLQSMQPEISRKDAKAQR